MVRNLVNSLASSKIGRESKSTLTASIQSIRCSLVNFRHSLRVVVVEQGTGSGTFVRSFLSIGTDRAKAP